MTISASPNSEGFTASVPTKSANGSKDSDSARNLAHRQSRHLTNGTSLNDQADNRRHFSTSGTENEPRLCSTGCVIHGPFTILSNGSIGQTVLDADGNAVAWTTDVMVAQAICGMLNEYSNNQQEGL